MSNNTGGLFIDPGGGSGSSPTPSGPDGGCFGTALRTEPIKVPTQVTVTKVLPFDMFIMYDQSGSMNSASGTTTRWDAVKAALTGFVTDSSSDGIGVGIQYFPQTTVGAPPVCFQDSDCGNFGPCDLSLGVLGTCKGGDQCTPGAYATPDVPIEDLPAVSQKIIDSVNAHNPGGGTPTAPALQGALNYAIPWAAAHPDRKTIVVLATDGQPSGCTANTVQDVANIAASGLAANPPVKTFVIGVGSSLTSLNSIAASGGTDQALIVDTGADPKQQFLEAMQKIRDTVTTTETVTETQYLPLPCDYAIPPPPEDETFDKTRVNVDFTAGNAQPERLGAVPTEADCASVADGWYYDVQDKPTKVIICKQTCDRIQATRDASVAVAFGCETEPAIIQ